MSPTLEMDDADWSGLLGARVSYTAAEDLLWLMRLLRRIPLRPWEESLLAV